MLEQDFLMAIDPVAFSQSVGIVPDPWQAEVLRSDSRRLLLNCCRQAGKSTTTAIKALHTAIYHPHSLILLGSPSLRQSSELFRKVRESYNKVKNPPKLTEDNKLSLTMTNGSRIVSLPGDPATVRGYSGVALFLDQEPVKDEPPTAVAASAVSRAVLRLGIYQQLWYGANCSRNCFGVR